MYYLLASLSTLLGLSMAAPVADAQSSGYDPCAPGAGYSHVYITDQHQLYTNSFTGGVSTPAGSSVQYNEGYSIGWTVTLGANLGISFGDIYSAGITASVSETTTTTTSQGASVPCPSGGGWYCAAVITPSYQQVDGWVDSYFCGNTNTNNYTALIPYYENNIAVIQVGPCACPDLPSSTDAGAPPLCPGACGTA